MFYSLNIFAVTQTASELLHSLSICYYTKDLWELYPFVTCGALHHISRVLQALLTLNQVIGVPVAIWNMSHLESQ